MTSSTSLRSRLGSPTHLSFDCYGTLIDWESGILGVLRPWVESAVSERDSAKDDSDTDPASAATAAALPIDPKHPTDADLLRLYARFEAEVEAGPYLPYREVLAQVMEKLGHALDLPVENRYAIAESVGKWPAFPDTVSALVKLSETFQLVILSNVDRDMFTESAKTLEAPFAHVITAEDVGSYKPSPRNFDALFEQVGSPDKILHVAQSLFHDHVPAKSAGMYTVWINRPSILPGQGITPDVGNAVEPDAEFRTLQEFLDAIES